MNRPCRMEYSADPTPSTLTKHADQVRIHDFNETLRGIAREGNLDQLYEQLDSAPKILDQIDEIPFVHTPLHEAAAAGKTYFALEILRLKPSFGRKLNPNGPSPVHVALQNRELVKRLIKCDSELIRVKGRERKTPLHHVAETGDTDLLAEFLCVSPESIRDLTIRDETALHVAVKEGRVLAFKLIFEWVWRTYRGELLNWKDENGNTVLHIAVSCKEHEIVKLLVARAPIIEKERNLAGWTALDIVDHDDHGEGIRNILLRRHIRAPVDRKILKDAHTLNDFLLSPEPYFEKFLRFILYCRRDLSLDMRNMVLVVAVLIATATFDALDKLSENQSSNTSSSISSTNTTAKLVGDMSYYLLNTISFIFSIAVMISVLSFRPFTTYLHLSLLFMAISYGYRITKISTWLTAPAVGLIVLVYASKLYFENMEREIRMQMPALWTKVHPRWQATPPVPIPLERLRMVYRLMDVDNPSNTKPSDTNPSNAKKE